VPLLNVGFQGEKIFQVDADLIVTGRTCIIGASGSGKSNTLGVFCEELCKNAVPFALIDIEGEYSGLKKKYGVIWIGEEEKCDLSWSTLDVKELAKKALDIAPLILDVSEVEDPKGKIGEFLSEMFKEISARRTPYLIILEEADKFIPQVGERLKILEEVARRGRKRGLGLMLCTQRPSLVDKNVLSQCSNQLIGKLNIKNDLEAVSPFFLGHGLPKHLTTLSPGIFYALGGFSPIPIPVKIRLRETTHGGITPKLKDRVIQPAEEVLTRLRKFKMEKKVLGLSSLISLNDIPSIVKKEKRFIFFGEEEKIADVQFIVSPLVQLIVRIRTGLLKKRFDDRFFVLDGITGRFADLDEGLVFEEGMEQFIGLNQQQIEVLKILKTDKDSTVIDILGESKISESVIRGLLKFLENKRLISSYKNGKIRLYHRLVELPKIDLKEKMLSLENIDVQKAKIENIKLKEAEVREVVKGLFSGSDLVEFKTFFYPIYKVELILGRKKRVIWIDGRNGKKIDF
jgi:predicted transcriptional regulator